MLPAGAAAQALAAADAVPIGWGTSATAPAPAAPGSFAVLAATDDPAPPDPGAVPIGWGTSRPTGPGVAAPVASVPEPPSGLLLLAGLGAVAARRLRRLRAAAD